MLCTGFGKCVTLRWHNCDKPVAQGRGIGACSGSSYRRMLATAFFRLAVPFHTSSRCRMYPLSLLLLLTDSSSALISRSSRFSPCRKGMLVVVTCCHNWVFQHRKLGGSQVETGLYYVGQSDEAACRHIRLRQLPPKRNKERLFSLFHCIWRGIVRPGRQRVAMQIERSLDKKWYQL